jgi:hypothetical protein
MPTEAHATVAIGRETNYTEEAGVLNEPEYTTFPDPGRDQVAERALSVLRATARTSPHDKLASALGLSRSGLRRFLRSGRVRAQTGRMEVLLPAKRLHGPTPLKHFRMKSNRCSTSQRTNPGYSSHAAPRAERGSKDGRRGGATDAAGDPAYAES